jgi:hypothetical protein
MRHDQASLKAAIASLSTPGPEKFKTAKALVAMSETHPQRLSPLFNGVAELLEAENQIIKWAALKIIANLACTDEHDRIEKILPRYLAPISGPAMISANVAIQGAAKVARCRKNLTSRIVQAILQVENATYTTEECRHIAIGHAITALGTMEIAVKQSPGILAFVRRQCQNPRPATRKKAEHFLRAR